MAEDKTFTKDELDAAVAKAVEAATGDVDGLKAKVDELIGDNKKLKAEARKAKDVDPAEVERLHAELEDAQAKRREAEKLAKDATATAEKATKALDAETGFTHKLLAENGVVAALTSAGVTDPTYLDVAKAFHLPNVKVVPDGDKRTAMYGDKPLEEAIKEWAATDAGKKLVSAANNSGGGSGGGAGKQPAKTMPRATFEALPADEKVAAVKDGVQLVDAAA
jgi:regulator of replication initiation timing